MFMIFILTSTLYYKLFSSSFKLPEKVPSNLRSNLRIIISSISIKRIQDLSTKKISIWVTILMANSLRSETREAIVLYLANGTKVMSRHVTPFRKRYFTFRALSSNVYSISRQIQWTFNQAEGRVVLYVV